MMFAVSHLSPLPSTIPTDGIKMVNGLSDIITARAIADHNMTTTILWT